MRCKTHQTRSCPFDSDLNRAEGSVEIAVSRPASAVCNLPTSPCTLSSDMKPHRRTRQQRLSTASAGEQPDILHRCEVENSSFQISKLKHPAGIRNAELHRRSSPIPQLLYIDPIYPSEQPSPAATRSALSQIAIAFGFGWKGTNPAREVNGQANCRD